MYQNLYKPTPGSVTLFIGPMFSGKCLGRDTPVLLHDGRTKLVQNITTHDVLMGDDSMPRCVLGICNGIGDLYRIDYGAESFIVNKDHMLTLQYVSKDDDLIYNEINKSWELYWFDRTTHFVAAFPISSYLKHRDYDIRNIALSAIKKAQDESVAKASARSAAERYRNSHPVTQPGTVIDISVEEIIQKTHGWTSNWLSHWQGYRVQVDLPEVPTTEEPYLFGSTILEYNRPKLIPDMYKYNSAEKRLSVVNGLIAAGLIDYISDRDFIIVNQTWPQLTDDIIYLIRSLGFIPNNVRPIIPSTNLLQHINITYVGKGHYYGFELDQNGRFVLGNFVVTHNTSSMIREVERYNIANKKCTIVKFVQDTRYDSNATKGGIVTHALREHADVPVIKTANLMDVYDQIADCDVIGIDELQFFPDSVEFVQKLANDGKIIFAAGLDADFRGKSFGRMSEIIPLVENIFKLKAVCMKCSGDASFTTRTTDESEIVDIGGKDKYIAVCRQCMWGNKEGK